MKIEIVFIHGWAMNSAVWQPCLRQLPSRLSCRCIDLPGYGDNAGLAARTLDDYVEYVAQCISRPSILVGWSLGGLVSLQLALRYPEKLIALFQVASNPRFVQSDGWQCGIDAAVFEQFAQSLEQDIGKTIRRFLALQVRGTSTSLQTVRQLQQAIDEKGVPSKQTLLTGLRILSNTDLSAELAQLNCATTWLLGEKDTLVPLELAVSLQQLSSRADVQVLQGAGHAPFISHPQRFVQLLLQALDQVGS